jgi:hypothetical protein
MNEGGERMERRTITASLNSWCGADVVGMEGRWVTECPAHIEE